jgi:hypothetical protein
MTKSITATLFGILEKRKFDINKPAQLQKCKMMHVKKLRLVIYYT